MMPPMSGDDRLKHNPFSKLRGAAPARPAEPKTAVVPPPLSRLIVREELDTETSAVLARVIGVPQGQLSALGRKLREALGISVAIEGRDLLALGGDCERVAVWLRGAGASEVVVVRRPPDLSDAGRAGGTVRSEIRRGLRVAIVQKADQGTCALTEGVVRDILTSSPEHPRGIKVRLETGQVGRVRRILG